MSTDTASFDHPLDLRAPLTQRLNQAARPSRLINELQAIDSRCNASATALKRLIERAPRCLAVIRGALREAFDLDPDTVLFIEPGTPELGPQVSSLTERALGLLSRPSVPINIHHYTRLSLKGDEARVLAFNAAQALARVKALDLLGRLERVVADYWQQLAYGAWQTRKERWVTLRKQLFADQAFVARQLDELSGPAYALVCQLIDAPSTEARSRAGGEWADVQVGTLLWPGTYQSSVTLPGALHLSRPSAAGQGLQVVYLPGLAREFHVFASWAQLQCDLPALLNGPVYDSLWSCLPLRRRHEVCRLEPGAAATVERGRRLSGDALAHSAHALVEGQWDNELACALSINPGWVSFAAQAQAVGFNVAHYLRVVERARRRLAGAARLGPLLKDLLDWDQRRRASEIHLPSLPAGLALRTREHQVQRYESGLLALLDSQAPAEVSPAYQALLDLEAKARLEAANVLACIQVSDERLFEKTFWLASDEGTRKRADRLLSAHTRALLYEARLQQQLKLLGDADVTLLERALQRPRAHADACALQVTIGPQARPMLGVLVVTTAQARAAPASRQPVLLWVTGRAGGLARFESLEALSAGLLASLYSIDGGELSRRVARELRDQAPAAWTVAYASIDRPPLQHLFLEQVREYARLAQSATLFSEITDTGLARGLLAHELSEQLRVPVNAALAEALATVELWRLAAAHVRHQPAWLSRATTARRNVYKRLQGHYLAGALAFEDKLWQQLPDLEAFARARLIERLSQDGLYPQVDIDQPLLEMPDDVSQSFCGWSSQCVVGDRHAKNRVSAQRSTFSLLQLALHNLDPQAPWTEWRLNRAHYLAPQWQAQLNPAYLIKTVAELDIGGRYQALIQQTFYPGADGLIQALSERVLQQQARMQLFAALQEGMPARSLFDTAMAARTADDLRKNGHHLRLCVVRLVGYTLEHDRHIAGLLLFHDQASQHCVVYWPAAFDFPAITHFVDLNEAIAALNQRLASAPQVKRLARQVAPGWEAQALASYPGAASGAQASGAPTFSLSRIPGYLILRVAEAIARFIRTFKIKHRTPVALLAAIEAQIQEQIDAAPHAWLAVVPTTHSDPLKLLTHARLLEIQHRSQGYSNSAAVLAVEREQRLGAQREATIRGLLSFVPVIGVGISLYEMLLAARRYHLGGDPHDAVDVAFMTMLAFFDVVTAWVPKARAGAVGRGAIRASLHHLRPRSGLPGLRTALVKPVHLLERFKKQPHSLPAIALQAPGNAGVYVQNGKQFLLVDGHRYPVYRRKHESVLRLQSPDLEGQNELVLHIEQPREWLLGADAPQPGPSRHLWRPWGPTSTQWSAPSQAALRQALAQSPPASAGWQAWGFVSDMTLTQLPPPRGIYLAAPHTTGESFRVLTVAQRYYRLLPEGDALPSENLVFITRHQSLAHSASLNLNHWLGMGLADQPLPATLSPQGAWSIHRPLFGEPLWASLVRVFPLMTASSRRFLIERLIELTDPSRSVTAAHLLGIRATLDRWMSPLGQTDDLLKMLRPIESRMRNLYLGYDGFTPGFNRLDFVPPYPLDRALRASTRANMASRAQAIQRAVRTILEQQGFVVQGLEKNPGTHFSVDFFCAHPQSNNRYYVLTRWSNDTRVKLNETREIQLTDAWFARRSTMRSYLTHFSPIKKALDEQRLVKIIAGIQWTGKSLPTVYFVRFGGVTPEPAPLPQPPRTSLH